MRFLLAAVGFSLIAAALVDAFEVMVLPRRINRRLRLASFFALNLWSGWRRVALSFRMPKRREWFLSLFGPLFLLLLLVVWSLCHIFGFALVNEAFHTLARTPNGEYEFLSYVYMSGVTFFTLGYGDVVPFDAAGRVLAVFEAGFGLGFLAVVIGYLPVLHGAFWDRELAIQLLDARAGSPPVAGEYLVRAAATGGGPAVLQAMQEWEKWAAGVLGAYLAYPTLCYYRSQHDNQNWVAALTMMLDTCALVLAGWPETCHYQARLTFAMLRHTVVDTCLVFRCPPLDSDGSRLSPEALRLLETRLAATGKPIRLDPAFHAKLAELRDMYEPFARAIGRRLLFELPPIAIVEERVDNWQTSAWRRRTAGIGQLSAVDFEGPGVH